MDIKRISYASPVRRRQSEQLSIQIEKPERLEDAKSMHQITARKAKYNQTSWCTVMAYILSRIATAPKSGDPQQAGNYRNLRRHTIIYRDQND